MTIVSLHNFAAIMGGPTLNVCWLRLYWCLCLEALRLGHQAVPLRASLLAGVQAVNAIAMQGHFLYRQRLVTRVTIVTCLQTPVHPVQICGVEYKEKQQK